MTIIQILAGPLIGGLIGYCTNYIAVKMLFRPLHPVKIAGRTLPFTPGLIPKRKDALAKIIGKTVGEQLLTKKDMGEVLLSAGMKKAVIGSIVKQLENVLQSDVSVKKMLASFTAEEEYEQKKESLVKEVSRWIVMTSAKMNLGKIIAEEGSRAVKEKTEGTMLAMFVNDKLVASIADILEKKVNTYMETEGEDKIIPVVASEMQALEEKQLKEILAPIVSEMDKFCPVLEDVYEICIQSGVEHMIGQFHVAGIIQEKIQAMEVAELEKLALSVMKTELDAIVNLGALLGFLIGILNIFV